MLASFNYALKDTGVLLLGKSESLDVEKDLFTVADRRNNFFTRNATAVRAPVEMMRATYEYEPVFP